MPFTTRSGLLVTCVPFTVTYRVWLPHLPDLHRFPQLRLFLITVYVRWVYHLIRFCVPFAAVGFYRFVLPYPFTCLPFLRVTDYGYCTAACYRFV